MSSKHKAQKKQSDVARKRPDEAPKPEAKPAKSAATDDGHDMPGAAGFISAGAEEDTYD